MVKSTKVISKKALVGGGARGGDGKMFGKDSAGPQKSGVSHKSGKGGGNFAAGGHKNHMTGQKGGAMPSGKTSR